MSPLTLVIGNHVLVEQVFKVLVAQRLIDAVISDGDAHADKAHAFVLDDIDEQFGALKVSDSLVNSLGHIAWVEDIQFFLPFVCWLGDDVSMLVDMLLETLSDVWLTGNLDGCVITHVFDYI